MRLCVSKLRFCSLWKTIHVRNTTHAFGRVWKSPEINICSESTKAKQYNSNSGKFRLSVRQTNEMPRPKELTKWENFIAATVVCARRPRTESFHSTHLQFCLTEFCSVAVTVFAVGPFCFVPKFIMLWSWELIEFCSLLGILCSIVVNRHSSKACHY